MFSSHHYLRHIRRPTWVISLLLFLFFSFLFFSFLFLWFLISYFRFRLLKIRIERIKSVSVSVSVTVTVPTLSLFSSGRTNVLLFAFLFSFKWYVSWILFSEQYHQNRTEISSSLFVENYWNRPDISFLSIKNITFFFNDQKIQIVRLLMIRVHWLLREYELIWNYCWKTAVSSMASIVGP